MNQWDTTTLSDIMDANDLHIAPFRDDGKTPGTPTWIWCVTVDGELYVRAYNGTRSRWYNAAVTQQAGQILAAGQRHDVDFAPIEDQQLNERIDDAYRARYSDNAYLAPMIGERASAATVRIRPR